MLRKHIHSKTAHIIVGSLALAFFAQISWMTFRQYAVFHMHAPDVVMFSQSIWYTLRGTLLYNTLDGHSALAFHFTPIFMLLAPALWIWEDPRVFFLIQTAGITISGLILWHTARNAVPRWAIILLAVYFLNSSLHEVAINELRRITLAMPFISLALYGLYSEQKRPLLWGLFFALLCKEDVAILVFTFGVFVMFVWKDWKLGSFLAIFGITSFFFLTFCLVPSLHPDQTSFGCYPEAYPQLKYFTDFGDSDVSTEVEEPADSNPVSSAILSLVLNPDKVLGKLFDADGRAAIFRTLLPFALILPLLGWEYFLLAVPSVALMMLSSTTQLHTLRDWYLAPILPIVTLATIVGLQRIPGKWQKYAIGMLILCTLGSYYTYSHLPGGQLYVPIRYQLTEHHHIAQELLTHVPDDAAVIAQDAFTQHLSMRPELYHLRWNSWEKQPYDYLVLDRNLKHYPFDQAGINNVIDERIADPALTVTAEGDGMYLFQANGEPNPAKEIEATAEGSIHLEKVEFSISDEQGIFFPQEVGENIELVPEQTVRVTLYWQAKDKPVGNRTASVRISDSTGWLIAQHDSVPSNGARPTASWEPDWYFRDVYYLTVPAGTAPSTDAQLTLRLYDSSTLEIVSFEEEKEEDLLLTPVDIKTQP